MSLIHKLPSVSAVPKKRVGRGFGSGKGGHTSGRGQKGQGSRQGKAVPLWFEGGQLPLIRRLPFLRGMSRFNSLKKYQEVQLSAIVTRGLTTVNPAVLKEKNLIDSIATPVRVIGKAEVKEAITLQGVATSGPVKAAIEAAGGTVTL